MKIPECELEGFRSDIVSILSPIRLSSYEGDMQRHFNNLEFSKSIMTRLAILEIYLRNMLVFCLTQNLGEEWIKSERSLKHIKAKGKNPLSELSPHQILSTLMFGEIVGLSMSIR